MIANTKLRCNWEVQNLYLCTGLGRIKILTGFTYRFIVYTSKMKVPYNGYMGIHKKCYKHLGSIDEPMNDNWEINKFILK